MDVQRTAESDSEIKHGEYLHGVQKLDFYLELAHRREKSGDLDGSIAVLKRGIDSSSTQGRLHHTLQFFGHLRRYYLQDARFSDLRREILWYYKWIVTGAIQYAEIPLATVETLIDQMEQFYITENAPLRPVCKIRCVAAMYTGRPQAEQEWFDRMDAEAPSSADDCAACEWGFRAERFVAQKSDAEALAVAEPILNPRNWCRATPEIASLLIGAALRRQKLRLAHWLCVASRRAVRRQDSMLDSLGYHAAYHCLHGDFARSRRLAILGLLKAKESRNDRRNAAYYRNIAFWAAVATLRTDGKATLPANLFGIGNGEDAMPSADVAAASLRIARDHSKALDERNGTTFYMDKVDEFDRNIRKMFSPRSRADDDDSK